MSSLPSRSSAVPQFSARGPKLPVSAHDDLVCATVYALRPRRDYHKEPVSNGDLSGNHPPVSQPDDDPDLPALPRSILPVFITANYVVRVLRTTPQVMSIGPPVNISADYVKTLDERSRKLRKRTRITEDEELIESREDSKLRMSLKDEAYLTIWEAAVVRAKLLTRWEVVLRKD